MPSTLASLVDLVLPRRCLGCRLSGTAVCDACLAVEVRLVTDDPLPGLPVVAGSSYGGSMRRAVLAYKERGRRDLVRPLGAVLGRAVRALVAGVDPTRFVLVAAPSSRAAAAGRGGDHVLRLARRAAATSGVRLAPGTLRLARAVQDSSGLTRTDRERNLHRAIRARSPAGLGRLSRAIVVDDIVTTGATLREIRRALIVAGWDVAGAAVIASTPRRDALLPLAGHINPV